jgi:hypothetical protein
LELQLAAGFEYLSDGFERVACALLREPGDEPLPRARTLKLSIERVRGLALADHPFPHDAFFLASSRCRLAMPGSPFARYIGAASGQLETASHAFGSGNKGGGSECDGGLRRRKENAQANAGITSFENNSMDRSTRA